MSRFAPIAAVAVLAACDLSAPPPQDRLLAGTWGGDDAGLIVSDTATHVHIGCTKGDIFGAVTLDPQGRFDLLGEYNIDAYPVDRGIIHPARFVGDVDDGRLTLTVALTDTLYSLGPVVLTLGREPEMRMCPICTLGGEHVRMAVRR